MLAAGFAIPADTVGVCSVFQGGSNINVGGDILIDGRNLFKLFAWALALNLDCINKVAGFFPSKFHVTVRFYFCRQFLQFAFAVGNGGVGNNGIRGW